MIPPGKSKEAVGLGTSERLHDDANHADAEERWAAELDKRVQEVREGTVEMVDGEVVLERARERLTSRSG